MVSLTKVFIIVCVLEVFCTQAHFTIDIEPEELQSIGQVLVESYLTHNLIQKKATATNFFLSQLGKFTTSAIQISAITFSLVCANLLTTVFTPAIEKRMQNYQNVTFVANKIKKTYDICPNDFGCNDYMCWRSCSNGLESSKAGSGSWCYTTTKPKTHEYQHCVHSYECSPCWACLGPCN